MSERCFASLFQLGCPGDDKLIMELMDSDLEALS